MQQVEQKVGVPKLRKQITIHSEGESSDRTIHKLTQLNKANLIDNCREGEIVKYTTNAKNFKDLSELQQKIITKNRGQKICKVEENTTVISYTSCTIYIFNNPSKQYDIPSKRIILNTDIVISQFKNDFDVSKRLSLTNDYINVVSIKPDVIINNEQVWLNYVDEECNEKRIEPNGNKFQYSVSHAMIHISELQKNQIKQQAEDKEEISRLRKQIEKLEKLNGKKVYSTDTTGLQLNNIIPKVIDKEFSTILTKQSYYKDLVIEYSEEKVRKYDDEMLFSVRMGTNYIVTSDPSAEFIGKYMKGFQQEELEEFLICLGKLCIDKLLVFDINKQSVYSVDKLSDYIMIVESILKTFDKDGVELKLKKLSNIKTSICTINELNHEFQVSNKAFNILSSVRNSKDLSTRQRQYFEKNNIKISSLRRNHILTDNMKMVSLQNKEFMSVSSQLKVIVVFNIDKTPAIKFKFSDDRYLEVIDNAVFIKSNKLGIASEELYRDVSSKYIVICLNESKLVAINTRGREHDLMDDLKEYAN